MSIPILTSIARPCRNVPCSPWCVRPSSSWRQAGRLTAQRTAATTALAVDALARPGARTLVVIGLVPSGAGNWVTVCGGLTA